MRSDRYFFALKILYRLVYTDRTKIHRETMQAMYADILEDVSKDTSILETTDRIYRTDDAQIFSGFSNTTEIYNVKTKDPEKWLLPSESTVRVTFQLTNAAENAAQADVAGENMATLIAGGLHLFEQIRLIIDDNQVELVRKPGYCHVLEHLLTSSVDELKSCAENEWLYLDDGSFATGALTEAAGVNNSAFILGTETSGAAVQVLDEYGMADAVKYLGVNNVGANLGGYNPRYNSGFAARWVRSHPVAEGKDIELAFPAKRLFAFFADIRCAWRGVQFEIEFTKNINYTEIIHGKGASATAGAPIPAAALAHTLIKKIDWIMPTLIPNTLVLEKVQRQLQSGDKVQKVFNSTTTYHTTRLSDGNPLDIDWRVQSTGKKITRVAVGFQRASQFSAQNDPNSTNPLTTATHSNGGVFSTLDDINAVELRFGSTILPKERYQRLSFSDAAPNFSRVYVDFCNAGGRWIDNDDGCLVSYKSFQKLYPLFVFDLSQMDLTKANTTSEDLRVVATVNAPAGDVRVIAMVSYEYPINMYAVDGRLGVELP